ncbi:MAG: tRNA (adenosine(37)-N6)-dimethylallyltransferase MiaA [Puniceicoccales bacterium]|jgi:tRNA dimethylallyltransferase|nr:tRNA (adenosine(37)-N6)-dimethylallyltransferase MiaA [Puniceicoccales bacterium]
MQKLLILTGYTAAGKTELSLEIAEQIGAEIVSCDSLLVYKDLNIGTAKPTQRDLNKIRHHCVNLVESNAKFDAGLYVETARCAIDGITSRGKNVLVVGGSGFYLKSFFHRIIDGVKTTAEAENFVCNTLANNDNDALVRKLLELNGGRVSVDLKNPRRVISSLKRCMSTGKTLAELQKNFAQQRCEFCEFDRRTVLLVRDDDDLKRRIHLRTKNMVANGLIGEVKNLLGRGQFNGSNKNAIGYRETMSWLGTGADEDALVQQICTGTLKLLKKQKTWFRKQIPVDLTINLTQTPPREAKSAIIDLFSS